MPIFEIHMLPDNIKDLDELENRLINVIVGMKEIKNIRSNEVMVNIIKNTGLGNTGKFVYIVIWLYQREERTPEIIRKLVTETGKVVFDFLKTKIPEFKMLEVLPPRMVDEKSCFVLGSLN